MQTHLHRFSPASFFLKITIGALLTVLTACTGCGGGSVGSPASSVRRFTNNTQVSDEFLQQTFANEQAYMLTTPLRANPFQPLPQFDPQWACPSSLPASYQFAFGGSCVSHYDVGAVSAMQFENIEIDEIGDASNHTVNCPGLAQPVGACTSYRQSDGAIKIMIAGYYLQSAEWQAMQSNGFALAQEPEMGLGYEFGNALLYRAGDYTETR